MYFDYESLNSLRIHDLRDLARKVGVKSPTSLKKEVIIENILAILSGENKPYINTTKQGRPAKDSNKFNNLVNILTANKTESNEAVTAEDYDLKRLENFSSALNAGAISYNDNSKLEKVKGYLYISSGGYGFVRVNGLMPSVNDVFVHPYLIKNFNLHSGDYIEGETEIIEENNSKIMVTLTAFNGNYNIDNLPKVTRFNDIPYNALSNSVFFSKLEDSEFADKFSSLNLKEGGRYLFLCSNSYGFCSIIRVIETLKQNYRVYVLNLDAMPEDKHLSDKLNGVVVNNINFNETDDVLVESATLMLEVAKREVESGEKVVFIVNKLGSLIRALNNLNSKEISETLKVETAHKIKNFLMGAKNINNNSNLTLLVFDLLNTNQTLKSFIEFDLSLIFHNTVKFAYCTKEEFKFN